MRVAYAISLTLLWLSAPSAQADLTAPSWLEFRPTTGLATVLPDTAYVLPEERRTELVAQGHPYTSLLQSFRLELGPRGQLTERITLVRHLLNDEGVRAHGTISLPIRPLGRRLVIHEAWARLRDGQVIDLDLDTIQIVPDTNQDVFSDRQNVVFPFSGLEPGTTIALVVEEVSTLAVWPLPWARMYFPQGLTPVEHFNVEVRWPPSVRPPTWASDDPDLGCAEATGGLSCSRRIVPALPFDPAVVWADQLPHLSLSGARNWPDLTMRERHALREAALADAGVDAIAEGLALSEGPPEERLARIHRFTADEVRYSAFEHGTGAVVPRAAATTLSRRYGDCKDKVSLFLALAQRARLDARPVLVASSRYAVRKLLVPAWTYFDHMISCVEVAPERSVCVDLTDPHSTTGDLPLRLQGAVAIDLEGDLSGPRTLPAPEHGWRIDIESVNEVACDGSIVERLTRTFAHGGAAAVRATLAGLNSANRDRWLETEYSEVMGAVKPAFEVTGLGGGNTRLSLHSTTRFPAAGSLEDYTQWVEQDAWLVHYARQFRSENQHHPYRMPGLHLTSRSRYRLCGAVRSRFPGPALELVTELGSLERSYETMHDRSVLVTTELKIPRREVQPDQHTQFNRFIDRALSQTRISFILERASGAPK